MKKNLMMRECGSALLLSLAILALMMITGLAFLTNSLIARKNAFYNSSRNQAEFLGRMAINRAQGAVMLYQYLWRYNIKQDWLFTGFEEVVSHAPEKPANESSYDEQGYVVVMKNGSVDTAYNDGLDLASSLKLPDALNGSTYYQDREAADPLRKPQWVYVTNGETGDKRRVIGRYAFRVLPPLNGSRINLNAVLHTGLYDSLLTTVSSDAALVAQYKNNDFAWLLNQTPSGGGEKAIRTLTGVSVNTTNFPAVSLSGSAATSRGKWAETLVKPANNYAGGFDPFAQAWSMTEECKKRMMKYFDDSPFPAHVEVYKYNNELYHRFGLGQLKTSTTKILGQSLNSDAAVTALMTPAKVTEMKSAEDAAKLATANLCYTTNNGGISFLNRICSEAGNFPDVDTTDNTGIKLRRKQIAANLLDYCDTDDVPTSNVAAATWDVANTATYPNYTGNEKTAYLNEMGLFFAANAYQDGTGTLSDVTGNFPKSIKFNTDLRAFLEAVDVYNRRGSSALTYAGDLRMANVNAGEKSFRVKFNYRLRLEATFSYVKDEVPVSGVVKKVFSPAVDDADAYAADISTTESVVFSDVSLKDSLNGYFAGVSAVKTPTVTCPETDLTDLFKEARDQLPEGVSSIELTGYKIFVVSQKLTEAEWHPAAASLCKSGSASDKFDFVRHQPTATTCKVSYTPDSVTKTDEIEITSKAASTPTPLFAGVMGGVECRDPRQNLWLGIQGTGLDWSIPATNSLVKELGSFSSAISATGTVPSPCTFRTDDFSWLFGSLNKLTDANVANPSNPSGASSRDPEVVTDPAYYMQDATTAKYVSTAYIRNAPMQSAWELGAIHRGAPWQTINLKKAVGTTDTVYAEGDGAILDEVKVFDEVRSFGKLHLPEFAKECSNDAENALVFLKAWLKPLEPWKLWYDGTTVVDASAPSCETIATQLRIHFAEHPNEMGLERRSSALVDFLRLPTGCETGIALNSTNYPVLRTDAALEELAGRLIPMTEVRPGLVTRFRVLVKAQTIKDIGNDDDPANGKTVDRFKSDGTLLQRDVKFGRFDTDDNVTLDEITGEVYLLATFDRNPVTGAMKLRSVRHVNSANDANQ